MLINWNYEWKLTINEADPDIPTEDSDQLDSGMETRQTRQPNNLNDRNNLNNRNNQNNQNNLHEPPLIPTRTSSRIRGKNLIGTDYRTDWRLFYVPH